MTGAQEDISRKHTHPESGGKQPVVVTVTDNEFQGAVLEKLGRLETKIDMLTGNGQPGRMKLAEDRIVALEKDNARHSVYERVINAAITVAISAAIALRDRLWTK